MVGISVVLFVYGCVVLFGISLAMVSDGSVMSAEISITFLVKHCVLLVWI